MIGGLVLAALSAVAINGGYALQHREASALLTDRQRVQEGFQKTGVFTGSCAVNPMTGEPIPVFVADYVLMGYGTGAIMAVPAHDERDFEFAKKLDLPIRRVIEGGDELPYTGDGPMVNSGRFDGMHNR